MEIGTIPRSGIDRRQDNIFVEANRRSGIDRRLEPEKWRHYQKSIFNNAETAATFLPPSRKAMSAIDNFSAGNLTYAAGMAMKGINEIQDDYNVLKKAIIPGPNLNWDKQAPFFLVQGTLIEKTKLGRFLRNYDKTLFQYLPVQKALKTIGMTDYSTINNLVKIEGSWVAKLCGGAALRTPILGAGLFAAMETPNIFAAKNKAKELAKSGIKITLTMGLPAILGCIGRFYGPIVELALMGLGVIIGGKISKKINDLIS